MLSRISEEPFDIATHKFVRRFCVEHLRRDNVYAKCMTPEQIAERLKVLSSQTSRDMARRLLSLDAPQADDRELVIAAVGLGQGLGLGAAWGNSPEADLLWAGAALILEARGVDHPNDIPGPSASDDKESSDDPVSWPS